MRIDKYLGNLGTIDRSKVGQWTKKGLITLDGEQLSKASDHIEVGQTIIIHHDDRDEIIPVIENITVMIHKPDGYVSTNVDDGGHPSYRDLLTDRPYSKLINAAGRLDVDTTGLLLCTSDNHLLHSIIHPNHKVGKTYIITSMLELIDTELELLKTGVQIEEKGGLITTKPSLITRIDTHRIIMTIFEGRYHQVKKMLLSINNKVVGLHRAAIGSLMLGECLVGEFQVLSDEQIQGISEVDYNHIHQTLISQSLV